MENFTIFCTPGQTNKAIELGAPIRFASINEIRLGRFIEVESNNKAYVIPTAEQMIGWLEEQGIRSINIATCGYTIWLTKKEYITEKYITRNRKEATLAAIDAALEYIENLKQ